MRQPDFHFIVLNEHEDAMKPLEGEDWRPNQKVETGRHLICGGVISRHPSSGIFDVFVCEGECCLRVPVPIGAQTPLELSRHFGSKKNINQILSDGTIGRLLGTAA